MATQIISLARVWMGKYELTSDLNAVAIEQGVDAQDATTLGADTKIFKPGLKMVKASMVGLVNLGSGLSEEFLSAQLALADVPFTVAPTTGAEGELAFSFLAALASYSPMAGSVGDIQKFEAGAEASAAELVRGLILTSVQRSGSGNGTIFNPGAVAANQFLYGVLHFPAISGGPTVTVKIQSASSGGFGSPTDRITFTGVTVPGAQWAVAIPGPITDAFWRATWTFAGGAGPLATFVVNMAIQ